MKSIKEIYKIGKGPSSSHTMGPQRAAELLAKKYPNASLFEVTLYGSLAKTGKGHGTDKVIAETFFPREIRINFVYEADFELPHANTMDIIAYDGDKELGRVRVLSVGGGEIEADGFEKQETPEIYKEKNFSEIIDFCREHRITIYEYAERFEDDGLYDYLELVWQTMKNAIDEGIVGKGVLSGGLGVEKKAAMLYNVSRSADDASRENRLISAYAFAVSEQNADNGTVVTAPTCGSCGVLPAVLRYMQQKKGYTDKEILQSLAVAGVVGNVVKRNASLSGAECGCQAEVGTACSMAAAALSSLAGLDLDRIEYAAEIAMEHHIGLTCDPVCGLVQIPCIERNAVAALRAVSAADLAGVLGNTNKVSFDTIVKTMYETGKDLSSSYKETSEGGLAKLFGKRQDEFSELRRAEQGEYTELMRFLDKAFGFEKEEDKFISILPKLYKKKYDPCYNNLVMIDDNGISGAVGLYPIYYDVAGERLFGIALGNVAVAPDSRSKGYMSRMMERALEEADAVDADFTVLGGQRQRYERFDFYRVGEELIFGFSKANIKHRLSGYSMATLSIREVGEFDTEALDGIYKLHRLSDIRADRSREALFDILSSWGCKIYALFDDCIFSGYFLEDKNGVHEVMLTSEKYFYPLISEYFKTHSSMKIYLPAYDRKLIYLASDIAEEEKSEVWEMFRIKSFAKISGAFLKLLSKRRSLPDGSLVLLVHKDGEDEHFELSVKNGVVKVDSNTKKHPMFEFGVKEATSFLFSHINAERENLSPEISAWLPLPLTLRRADHG